jgi:hypothetical protein
MEVWESGRNREPAAIGWGIVSGLLKVGCLGTLKISCRQ